MFFILFFSSFIFADTTSLSDQNEVWDTRQTQKIINSKKTIQTLKDQEDCGNSSQSASNILSIFEILNKQEKIQALIDPGKKEFLCQVDDYVSDQNKQVLEDQKFMLSYLDDTGEKTKAEHIKMTELLIKYRLLRDKDWKEYYVSATRYLPPEEVKKQIRQLATNYINEIGPPKSCFFVKDNKVKKAGIKDEKCKNQILLRANPVPPHLILTQSVLESSWGKSTWARKESNILGLQVKFRNPSTMPDYSNCRPAEKDPSRCVLKFSNFNGAIYEYFSRFNASHLAGYDKYRRERKELYKKADANSCETAIHLSKSIDFYAENPNYVKEIQSMIDEKICDMVSTACLNESALTASR